MQVTSAESTELFVGPVDAPLQLVRVGCTGCAEPTTVVIAGDGLDGQAIAEPGSDDVEVPVRVAHPVVGQQRSAQANGVEFTFTVAEPGWTVYLVNHFHYDPVWWNTQRGYTSTWRQDPPGRLANGIDLVGAHLALARRDPDYKFVLAEVDYLKPFWDTHPESRAELRRLIAAGRVEVMGGTYNEPSTTLTGPETTIRNLVAGNGFQRDVLGLGESGPATAWQLDVFGHDPQFPGMAADAGLTSSGWARGPFHQWGPMAGGGDVTRMQFPSEFEWIAPSGRGLLTHYMPAHYGPGWGMDSAPTLTEAETAVYRVFADLKKVAATRNVLLPVGTDFTPPNRWVTEIHRDWNARYTWPRFVCALPREFFAAVRAELDARRIELSPQTRDMNPIYTGTHVSYIDTKQANRAAETLLLDAERFAVFAAALGGADYPQAALTKAWVQLAYGAHHDAITGSESDQVYLDLLTGWRDAWELGRAVRDTSLGLLSRAVGGDVVVWNPLAHNRTDIVTAYLDTPQPVRVLDADGTELPSHSEHGGRVVRWLARDVPSLGWRAYRLAPADDAAGWQPIPGTVIANEHHRLAVDPARGGGVVSLTHDGRELIAAGRVGNELAVYDEYPAHPSAAEGPWHLVPKGPVVGSSEATATVQAYRGPLGERIVVEGRIGAVLAYTQTLTLWQGVDRLDCRTRIDGFTGEDRLLRLRWPCPIPGALPVSEVADAVIGRGFALLHDAGGASVDTGGHPWTLDTAAYRWFGLSSAARVVVGSAVRAVAVAEVVAPGPAPRELMVALVRAGVTATCSRPEGPRYGDLDVDSNLPDARITLGGPDDNAFTAAVLAAADDAYTAELRRQLADTGCARVWVPAATPLAKVWQVDADLRDARALPVLIVAGLPAAVAGIVDDLADAEIVVTQRAPAGPADFEARTVALLNRGVPSFAVEADGTLHTALLRSCTGWPSGDWQDQPRRTAPDGSAFQVQHFTHSFDYALVSGAGDWRAAGIPARCAQFDQPLTASYPGGSAGRLPATGSLLGIEPAGTVALGALKGAGNPLARGSAEPVDAASVALRLVETTGATTKVEIFAPLGAITDIASADLLERARPGDPSTVHGFEIATVLAGLTLPRLIDAPTALGPEAETAAPLYARYWLHNRGPAPLGGLPAVAHLHPHRTDAEAGDQLPLRLSVASDCTDATLTGTVTLSCPPGWPVTPGQLPFTVAPGEHEQIDVDVAVPLGTAPGLYPLRAQLRLAGDVGPPAWRQPVEDVCLVSVGAPDDARLLYLVDGPADVELAAGESGRLAVTIGTDAGAELPAEAHLISPWGTWEWLGPACRGATLDAGGTVELGFDVTPPVWTEPGTWWALVRVGCAGALVYSPAVRVTVR